MRPLSTTRGKAAFNNAGLLVDRMASSSAGTSFIEPFVRA